MGRSNLEIYITYLIFATQRLSFVKYHSADKSQCPQTLFKYRIDHKAIVRHNKETMVNFEPK